MTTEDSMQYDESYGAYEEGYDEGAYYQEGGQEAASAAGMKFHTAPSALVEDSHLAALASFGPSPVNGLSTNCGLIRCTPRMVKYPVREGKGIRRTLVARCYKYSNRLHLFPQSYKIFLFKTGSLEIEAFACREIQVSVLQEGLSPSKS